MGKRVGAVLAVVAITAAMLDAGFSYVVLHAQLGVERSPVAAAAIHSVGLVPTLTAGLALRIAIAGVLAWIAIASHPVVARRAATLVLAAVAGWWLVIAVTGLNVVVGTRA